MKSAKKKSIIGVSLAEMIMLIALIIVVAISSIKLFALSIGNSYCDSASMISNAENIRVGSSTNGEMDFIPDEGCQYKPVEMICPGGADDC